MGLYPFSVDNPLAITSDLVPLKKLPGSYPSGEA